MQQVPSQNGAVGQLAKPWVPFISAILFLLLLLLIAFFTRSDPVLYYKDMALIIGLCVAAIANVFLAGYLEIKAKEVSAGGSLAVFVFAVWYASVKLLP